MPTKQIILDQSKSISEVGLDKFFKQKFQLPEWANEPIPGNPESFNEASDEYDALKEKIGIENITGAMDVLDSGDPKKILKFANEQLKDRPDLQEAMRRMAKYL